MFEPLIIVYLNKFKSGSLSGSEKTHFHPHGKNKNHSLAKFKIILINIFYLNYFAINYYIKKKPLF